MEEVDNTEEKEVPSTPPNQSSPQSSNETKQDKHQSRTDTKKAYSQPALNGSPGFSVHEEEGDVIFSPVKRLEFSSGNDETKQSDLASIDSNFLLTQDLSSSLENFGNFDNLLENMTTQSDLDKENHDPDENDIPSTLVIPNVQYVDDIPFSLPEKLITDTVHDRQLLPVQGIDHLDKNAISLFLQLQNQDQSAIPKRDLADCAASMADPDERLQHLDDNRQGYFLHQEHEETNVPALVTQEHRYPADGRNKQSSKQIVANAAGQSVLSGAFLPTYTTNSRPGSSYPPIVRTVPYGAEREEKNRTMSQVLVSSNNSNNSVKPNSPLNDPDSVNPTESNEPPANDHLQFSPRTLLTVVPDRTKFMQGGSKGDIEACPRPEDMPGGAMHEIELLRGQLQSAIQVPLKSQIGTDLFDYSQNGTTRPDGPSDPQLGSTISDIPSLSAVDATDNVSWLMDYGNNGLISDDPKSQLLETGPIASSSNAPMLAMAGNHSLQAGQYRQMPLNNPSQYTAYLDNIKLKEELEKERFRRRHCEKYIEQLNAKMLDTEEKLAVAVSADSKKGMLVEHLDKHLVKIMSAWKAKDGEKMRLINELQKEKNIQEQIIEDQRKLTSKMRNDFSDVIEELKNEREKTSSVIQKLEEMEANEKSLEKQLENEKEQNRGMVEEWEYQSERLRTSDKIVNELNSQMEQQHKKNIEREQELLKKIEEITESHRNFQQKEKEQTEELVTKVAGSETRVHSLENELSELKLVLENVTREKESLKVEIGIIEAKHENNQKQLETRLESQMEKEITAIIEDVHKKRESFENRLQEEHKQQIISLNEHHSVELNNRLQKYQIEIKQKDQKFSSQIQNFQQIMKSLREENTSLKISNQRLESQRTEALSKFQNIMHHQWNEAISILGGPSNVDSQVFSEITERSPESVTSEEPPIPPASYPAVKEPERCRSVDPHPHPQTSSPKKDALNISSFTVNSELINSVATIASHRRPKPPSETDNVHAADMVPNYLKSLTEENVEQRNQALRNSERNQRMKELLGSSKSQSPERHEMTVLEPEANILWYEKDSLQPSFIQTGPYMTAVPIKPPSQQDRPNHMLPTVHHRSISGQTSDHRSRSTSADSEIQDVESGPESVLTPPIKQSNQSRDPNKNNPLTDASKLKGNYQILSEHLMHQNSRQEELQHFIQMLLNRMPASKNLPTADSTNQKFEENESEFVALEMVTGNSTRMSEVTNMSQSVEKPERLVQTQLQHQFPLESHQPQKPTMAPLYHHKEPVPVNPGFPSGLTPSDLQDIQQLLQFYKSQENGGGGEFMQQHQYQPQHQSKPFHQSSYNGQQELGRQQQDLDPSTRNVQRSTGFARQPPIKSNKGYETKSREKVDGRRNRYNKPQERKKTIKISGGGGSGSNSSNTSGGNPVWK